MSKSPITCHVLVASVGKPGEHVRVKIEKEGAAGTFSVLSTAYVLYMYICLTRRN